MSATYTCPHCGVTFAAPHDDRSAAMAAFDDLADFVADPQPTPAQDTSGEVIRADVADLLTALGLGTHARDASPHEVVQREVLPSITALLSSKALLIERLKESRADEAESYELIQKQSEILHEVAAALKGDPEPGTGHSWHDLGEIAHRLTTPSPPQTDLCECGHEQRDHGLTSRVCYRTNCPCTVYRPATPSPQPERTGLVERVQGALCEGDSGLPLSTGEARTVALACADWLDERPGWWFREAAYRIRREVEGGDRG